MADNNPQKIIFLDIDGVLTSKQHDHVRYTSDEVVHEFDRAAVERLNKLCHDHQAKVVIVSSWVSGNEYTRDALLEYFKTGGFSGEFHDDWRIDDVGKNRGAGIDRWCAKNGIVPQNYIILDDVDNGYTVKKCKQPADGEQSMSQRRSFRWIPTSMETGMTDDHYKQADALLAGKALPAVGRKKE